jgi:hypothetical protein
LGRKQAMTPKIHIVSYQTMFKGVGKVAHNVHGFGLVWNFPTVRPEPLLIFCLVEVKN